MKKWELSMLIGVVAAVLYCATLSEHTMHWWTVAFEPLCDGLTAAEGSGEGVVIRSKLWELLSTLLHG